MRDDMEVRAVPLSELRFVAGEDGRPRIDARSVVYNQLSVDLGGFREQFLADSIELDPDLVALFSHDPKYVLGSIRGGTLTPVLDDAGVGFTAYPPATTWAEDLRVSMERGDIQGCSFRFRAIDDDFVWDPSINCVRRDVKRAFVSELTVTSMPAYPQTSAEARHSAGEVRSCHTQEGAPMVDERALTFAETLSDNDKARAASWTRLWQLENALENTIASLAGEGATDADAAVEEFAEAAKAWAVTFLDQYGAWYRDTAGAQDTDAQMRESLRAVPPTTGETTDTIAEGVARSADEGVAPSSTPGQVFIPGLGLRTFPPNQNGG